MVAEIYMKSMSTCKYDLNTHCRLYLENVSYFDGGQIHADGYQQKKSSAKVTSLSHVAVARHCSTLKSFQEFARSHCAMVYRHMQTIVIDQCHKAQICFANLKLPNNE